MADTRAAMAGGNVVAGAEPQLLLAKSWLGRAALGASQLDQEWLGEQRPDFGTLEGNVVVLFFQAHWCADCKRQGPVLEQALARHKGGGLRVFAPTQRFGYAAGGEDAIAPLLAQPSTGLTAR